MPPKGKAAKADVAKKQKVAEDKTFGLKNKNKSTKVQQYVQHINQSVKNAEKQLGSGKDAAKKKKEEAAAREKELNDIFKVAISQPKVPVGVDPKSIVCEFFRRGQCTKGFKCKFSHDLAVERKTAKIDLYSDQRDGEDDTMEDWDQAKLEEVVKSKGAEYKNVNRPTDIVCKHFLDAVEKKQYGWFWSCPNGGKECMYRHALPPGYVLKSQMKQLLEEESANKVAIEEEIEQRRHELKTVTPITSELFAEWKRKGAEKKEAELAAKRADRVKHDRMSGRELFTHDASLFVDDEDGFAAYERDEREEDEQAAASAQQEAQANGKDQREAGPSASVLTEEDEALLAEDDDELDLDELEELESKIANSSLHEGKQHEVGESSGT